MSDTAYAALGILSGESFDRRDLVSWQRWLDKALAKLPSPSAKTAKP